MITETTIQSFRVNILNHVLDIVNSCITDFKKMHDFVSRFSTLFPANLTREENIIAKDANLLRAKHSDGISPEFPIRKIVFEERWII